jgi:hypothetical protein
MGETFSGLPRSKMPRDDDTHTHTPVLQIPDVQGRVHHQAPSSEGSVEKASTTLAHVEDADATRTIWRNTTRRRRLRDP